MGKIDIVIIGQNEGESIQKMLSSLRLLMPNSRRIWVLDRCTDDSEVQLISECEEFIKTKPDLQGRQTSHARNLGISLTTPDSDVLILDGDRYPTGNGILFNLKHSIVDVNLLLLEDDARLKLRFHEAYGDVHNGFYSCGIFFKRRALDAIQEFQGKDVIFREDIQKDWGIEDVYLGDVCYHLGLTADIYYNINLRGGFDKSRVDSLDVIEQRFKLRDSLDVMWQGRFTKSKINFGTQSTKQKGGNSKKPSLPFALG